MNWDILQGDAIERLRELPSNSVHMCVTSPPYFGLRDYGIDGQIGLEATPAEFVQKMVEVFAEVARVLRADGTLWLNLGDSYAGSGQGWQKEGGSSIKREWLSEFGRPNNYISSRQSNGMKPKDLMLMPARCAIALQEWGWWIRSDIIWCKRAPMPESVTDRPTSAHEHIFLLSKSERYFYDADAIREGHARDYSDEGWANVVGKQGNKENTAVMRHNGNKTWAECMNPAGRNAWNYWLLSPEPYAAAHFATFPTEIPRRAIKAGSSEHGCCSECGAPYKRVVELLRTGEALDHTGNTKNAAFYLDSTNQLGPGVTRSSVTRGWQHSCAHNAPIVPCTVLDPFNGAGTTGMVALQLGRRYIGIELNPAYVELSRARIINDAPLFNMAVVA